MMGAPRAALNPLCGDLKALKAVVCWGADTGWTALGVLGGDEASKYTGVLNATVRRVHCVSGGGGPLKGVKQGRRGRMQGLQCCGNDEGRGLAPGFVEEGVMRGWHASGDGEGVG